MADVWRWYGQALICHWCSRKPHESGGCIACRSAAAAKELAEKEATPPPSIDKANQRTDQHTRDRSK